MRKSSLIWVGAAATLAFAVFHMKNTVQNLEDTLVKLDRDILKEQEAIHVLHAEWSYLNNPARLAELNNKFLKLESQAVKAHKSAPKDDARASVIQTVSFSQPDYSHGGQ